MMVNILPGGKMERFAKCRDGLIGCTTRRHIDLLHGKLLRLAESAGIPSLSLDYDSNATKGYFGDDMMHLTQQGHDFVSERLLELFSSWPS